MEDAVYINLACAVVEQAIKDCISANVPDRVRNDALRFLKSPWGDHLSNGMAKEAYKRIKENPDQIKENMHKLYLLDKENQKKENQKKEETSELV